MTKMWSTQCASAAFDLIWAYKHSLLPSPGIMGECRAPSPDTIRARKNHPGFTIRTNRVARWIRATISATALVGIAQNNVNRWDHQDREQRR